MGALALSIANCEHAQAQTTSQRVLLELFDATSLDAAKWEKADAGLSNDANGRTRFRPQNVKLLSETVGAETTRFVRLEHHRADYYPSSSFFGGAELRSLDRWKPYYTATKKVAYEFAYRMRVPRISTAFRNGLVAGTFSYGADGFSKDDEIDIEFLGNYLTDPVTPKRLWLNNWDDLTQNPQTINVPSGVDVSQWQEYRFTWSVNNITWAMKVGATWTTLRVVQRTDVGFPNEAQGMRFNIWAPYDYAPNPQTDEAFLEAADMSYIPTTSPSQDAVHYFDVDRIIVSEYTTQLSARTAPSPDGEARPEEPAVISPVTISMVEADVANQQVRLRFTGALDVKETEYLGHYRVTVNGESRYVTAAKYEADTQSVVLQLAEKSLQAGDSLRVFTYDLKDLNGSVLADQKPNAVIVSTRS